MGVAGYELFSTSASCILHEVKNETMYINTGTLRSIKDATLSDISSVFDKPCTYACLQRVANTLK
jgi:hypothetical protein